VSGDADGLRIRQAVRALLLTGQAEVLLVRFEFPGSTVWALPGGGLEPGEDHVQALHRELDEEVGLTDVQLGPHIWNREHIIPFIDGKWDGQQDRVFLVPTDRFEPHPTLSWSRLRAERMHELRWWAIDELRGAAGDVVFAPRRMLALIEALIAEGPPDTPVDTGV
jgi:8-oxo-dGTP pyrophosphatase MutT (NUDIX family)